MKNTTVMRIIKILVAIMSIILLVGMSILYSDEADDIDVEREVAVGPSDHSVLARQVVSHDAATQDIANVSTEPSTDVIMSAESTLPTCCAEEVLDIEEVCDVADDSPKYTVALDEDEIYTLATLVYLEGGTESYECQKAIASVVLNRMAVEDTSLYDIIYAPNQFDVAYNIAYSSPSDSTLSAVREVLEYGSTLPQYVLYFRASYYHDWGPTIGQYCNIDNTYFSYNVAVMEELT